jgi:hypothetical protein
MPKYRVRSGTHRREDGSRAEEGDVVEMESEVRERFGEDQFELVDVEEEDKDVGVVDSGSPVIEGEDEDLPEVDASDEIPEDYDTLRKLAKHYEGEEVHGSSSKEEIEEFLETLSGAELTGLKQKVSEEQD